MGLQRLPRRLQLGEEATFVEHLGELRSRILISLLAIIPAFIIAFVFRDSPESPSSSSSSSPC